MDTLTVVHVEMLRNNHPLVDTVANYMRQFLREGKKVYYLSVFKNKDENTGNLQIRDLLLDERVIFVPYSITAHQAMVVKRKILDSNTGIHYVCGVARTVCVDRVAHVYSGYDLPNISKHSPYHLRETAITCAALARWDKKEAEEIYDSKLSVQVLEDLCC
jgi:hypothetical protein